MKPKIQVYCMPGLAASSKIFEHINLPDSFEINLLDWILPLPNENIQEYCIRLSAHIKHENPVLIGVSFGGIVVQELANLIAVRKVIIISSVKTNLEFPFRMKLAKQTKAYKLIPTHLVKDINWLGRLAFGGIIKERLELYEKYLSVRDKNYLDWALETIINWERVVADDRVIHIHGDLDQVFPIQNISNCIIVKGGTHIMILTKYKWLNEHLVEIILK